jgi:5-methylcytosine-specific restriction protein A
MLAEKQQLIRDEVAHGTGAAIELEVQDNNLQVGLAIWFSDLQRPQSPQIDLRPLGLRRYTARLSFGNFCIGTISRMQKADDEKKQLARALVRSITAFADVKILPNQSFDDWNITGPEFSIIAEKSGIEDRFSDDSLINACREIVIPLLGAMAELNGYDIIEDEPGSEAEPIMEGEVSLSTVNRRERNPRNRLLCLQIHGEVCAVCDLDPRTAYGDAGSIIEVHHLQPLASSDKARHYDPAVDLVPLCPNCHKAVHTRRPQPWSPDELRKMFSANS